MRPRFSPVLATAGPLALINRPSLANMTNTAPISAAATDTFCIKDLSSFSPKERPAIIEKVSRIEKKTFPSSEAFDFHTELKKKNTTMILAMRRASAGSEPELVGYLVYLRMRRLTLLHKVCVVEHERGRGVGKCLIHSLQSRVEKGGCDGIHLWVDETRMPARALYDSCGFQQIDRCTDYYGPGRTGLKMQRSMES